MYHQIEYLHWFACLVATRPLLVLVLFHFFFRVAIFGAYLKRSMPSINSMFRFAQTSLAFHSEWTRHIECLCRKWRNVLVSFVFGTASRLYCARERIASAACARSHAWINKNNSCKNGKFARNWTCVVASFQRNQNRKRFNVSESSKKYYNLFNVLPYLMITTHRNVNSHSLRVFFFLFFHSRIPFDFFFSSFVDSVF